MRSIAFTLLLFKIAMENGPFKDGLPIKHGDFPWLCSITRWYLQPLGICSTLAFFLA